MYHSLKTLMFTGFLWSVSHGVYGQSQTFDSRLAAIQSLDDKSQALNELKSLSPLENEKQRFLVQKETFMFYWALNDFKQALSKAQEALAIARQSNFQEEIGITQKFIGIFHYYLGENEEALAAYEKSLQQFKILEKPLEQANIYNNISLVYTTTGEIGQALSAIQLAEPLFQTYGSEVDKVDIRYTLAVLHLRLKRYDIAIEMLLDVIDKRIAMNNDADLASAYADIGVAYKNARQLNNADYYMNKAMDYYLGQKDYYQVASQYQNIADLYIIKREYDKAEKYALKAIEISQQVGHQKAYIASLYNLAICLLYRGDTEQAFEHISRSTELAKKINYTPAVINNKAVLALTHASNQNMAEAIQYYHQFIFEVNQPTFAQAQFKTTLTAGTLSAIDVGEFKTLTVAGEINLHGESQIVNLKVLVAKLTDKKMVISSLKPIIIHAEQFALVEGIKKLQALAGLPSISNAVPVSFVLVFEQD